MLITLLTDFGTADYFVAEMKGVILSTNPRATIVDITHEIPAHDIQAGAFTLLAACATFPAGTIHVAVVDPGVGSKRRALVAACGAHLFVAPDNGLLSYVCERAEQPRFFHATNRAYFREPISTTFHGRDIFAPLAAALSNGVDQRDLGEEIDDPVRLAPLAARLRDDGSIAGSIIHIDRFGNCVTNITRRELGDDEIARGATLDINGHTVRSFRRFFADAADAAVDRDVDERDNVDEHDSACALFAIWGSAGFLEVAAFQTSAAQLLGAQRGHSVVVTGKR